MSTIDPSTPSGQPTPPPLKTEEAPFSFGACIGFGIALFIVGGLLSLPTYGVFGLLAFVGALISLFFKGYRGIFVGYIATLGVLILALVIICGISPPDFR